jgi:UDP-GlcNAc3NAcA epimerase
MCLATAATSSYSRSSRTHDGAPSVAVRHRLLSVLGARPEVIQAAALTTQLSRHIEEILVDTGQHYDADMAADQIADTRLPQPAYNLSVRSRSDAEQLELGERRIRDVIERERPDAVLVRGDTNATLAGARAAHRCGLPVIHVEAGLRSYRNDMPEERNRVETDRVADLLCAPTQVAVSNLEREGVRGRIRLTGDVLYDMLLSFRGSISGKRERRPYVLATIHRGYNTDDPGRLATVLECLAAVPYRVVFPVHPRTRRRLFETGLAIPKNVELRNPVPYTTFLSLERDAVAIVTDSGGVQREAYMWRVPCITLREETEWVETVETGWNVVVGVEPACVRQAFARAIPDEHPAIFGNGDAATRIADEVRDLLANGTAGSR